MTRDLEACWRRLAGEPRMVLLDGFHPVKHALRFGADVPLVVTADRPGMLELAGSLAPDLADRLDAAAVETDERTLRGLTGTRQHTKVAALARRPDPKPIAGSVGGEPIADSVGGEPIADSVGGEPIAGSVGGEPPRQTAPTVLLTEPRHLGNVGAVVRVAAGLGAAAVLTTGTVDPWHPDAIRGSAGLHFAVPTRRIDDAELARLPGPLLVLDPSGRDAREQRIPAGAVLAFGSERAGIPPGVRRRADAVLAIPMRGGVSSYNLATSVAMLLYQWTLSSGGGH